MTVFIIRRLNLFFFTMLMLTIISFSLSYLFPGDPLINLTGQIRASEQQLQQIALSYNSDQSIFYRYVAYIEHLFNGDFGISINNQIPISDEIKRFLPATIELSITALFISMIVGIPLGFIAAIKHGKLADNVVLTIAMVGYSVPVFWLGLLAILVFSILLGWLPSSGQASLLFEIDHVTGFKLIDVLLSNSPYKWQAFADALKHLILPASVVAVAPMTIFIRLARTSMLDVLNTNYIKAAKAKGLSFAAIIYRHATRNALIKIIRHIGLQFANLVTIAMVTEIVFDWPGVGRWLINSIYQRDYPAIEAGLLVLALFIFTVHIVTDIIYAALNPLAREPNNGS